MASKKSIIIIQGITTEGKKFRPSDWVERTCGALSTFKKQKIIYSPLLRPGVKNGLKCVLIDPELKISNPELYRQMIEFAENNGLQICNSDDKSDVSLD